MNSLLQNITQALGLSMAHSLWQGALIYGALCFVYFLLPKLTSKNKYVFALSGQFILLISFAITFTLYMDVSPTSAKTFMKNGDLSLTFSQDSYSQLLKTLEPLLPWMSSLYVLGLFIQLIIFSNSFAKLHYLKTQGISSAPVGWTQSFQQICDNIQIKKHIQFYLSDKVSTPLTIGHLKPIVLFPIAFVNHLKPEQVESILIHELAHIKRHDYLFNLFKVAIETILFFNPFVWLLSQHVETEREHACDDMAMAWIPSSIAYAQALMSVEVLKNTSAPAHAMAAIGKKHHLLHRIQRITNMEKDHINTRRHLVPVVLCSLALITTAWIGPKEKTTINTENERTPVAITTSETPYQIPTPATAPSYTLSSPDTIKPPLEPEDILTDRTHIKNVETKVKKIEAHHNSHEWKNKVADIEAQTKKTEEYFNSTEWKAKLAEIETNASKIEEYFNSPEWKNKVADIETRARKKTEEYFNSPEWKAKIADIEANANKIEAYYNSPEWKNKVADIEAHARKAEEYFNSPEWKAKIADIEANAKKMVEFYNSPE
ncbi:M56 family metallopeptidase [Sphingobacterium gobiense]|uniref:Peptidase M56 domain-containing protein n=1 Tax=Sphingobacterium gobiense TaxID=1382456 RepID=A0A2S9JKQ8_9SPHI|nr:M56 family metallopeptidase [Sphingobacterium gobiense]PRD53701.1 hypothetical protein C5749_09220 [Sphingobacterium gobiense]